MRLLCILLAITFSTRVFAAPEPEPEPEVKVDANADTPKEEAAKDEAKGKKVDFCPKSDKDLVVYGIGGSTMGSVLGPMLDKIFADYKVDFSRWGKASSGLARPDFHDWPAETPRLMKKHDPDIVIISLGTNDYQPLWVDAKTAIRQDDERWEQIYGERVDALLEAAAGKKKQRLIVWSGPYAFEGKNANVRAPIVNRIMRERVEAFIKAGGKAVFHDAYAATSKDGKPLKTAKLSTKKGAKAEDIRQDDGIHLTAEAVKVLLAEPLVELVMPCFKTEEAGKGD